MFVSHHRVVVEFRDCDPSDIVFYPNFFCWFDAATWWLFEHAGLTRQTMEREFNFLGLPILDAKAKFIAPARFHDELIVESHVAAWRDKTFDVAHTIRCGSVVIAEGLETRAWCGPHPEDPHRLKAAAIPKEVREKLSRGHDATA